MMERDTKIVSDMKKPEIFAFSLPSAHILLVDVHFLINEREEKIVSGFLQRLIFMFVNDIKQVLALNLVVDICDVL